MITKMNLDIIPETQEEKDIEKFLLVLQKSTEVKEFIQSMEMLANKNNVFKFRARVKDVNSAIRTYRIKKVNVDNVHDFVGISFITNNEREIYPIVEYLKSKLLNAEHLDFVQEEYIYSPLIYTKYVPPLAYSILAKEPLIPNERKVPIEIRISSKEAFISEQSAYYSVYKNDTIKMPIEEKNHLRDIIQHITYKFALLTERTLTDEEKEKHLKELKLLIETNKDILNKNENLFNDAILDFGRIVYELEYEEEIDLDRKNMNKSKFDDIEDNMKRVFKNLISSQKSEKIDAICNATKQMKKINYLEMKSK